MQIPHFLENVLGIQGNENPNLEMIPSLNKCTKVEDIAALNKKIVRFECMIQDMYDEEYFI